MKRFFIGIILMVFTITLFGCGETFTGVTKDVKRMGKGVRTVFLRDTD